MLLITIVCLYYNNGGSAVEIINVLTKISGTNTKYKDKG